jgi:hypothetical protein
MRRPLALLLVVFLCLTVEAVGQKGGRIGSRSSSRSSTRTTSTRRSSVKITSPRPRTSARSTGTKSIRPTVRRSSTVAARDSHGRIKRSATARSEFMRQTGYPKGRKGYVVDHIVPLECGGTDTPSNMQWQTAQEEKIKDRSEANCRR